MTPAVGDLAPDFTLLAQDRTEMRRDDLLGRTTLLVFIPFAFTATCEGELCTIRDRFDDLAGLGGSVVVITCDSRPVNARWAEENGFDFPILSDFWPHGAVTRAYGAFNDLYGAANRRTFVLDANAVIRDIVESDALRTPREFDAYLAALGTFERH